MAPLTDGSMQEAAQALRAARRITAICHENPDADTLGAAVAIALIGLRLGAETEIVSTDRPPAACRFLPLFDQISRRPRLEPDLAVVCDSASLDRIGRLRNERADWLAGARLMNIDHHATNALWGDVNLVDREAAATCQVIAELLPVLGVEPDPEIATALLAGIVRDSQGFADEATSATTLRVAAGLVETGVSLSDVQRPLLSELEYGTIALWGQILGTIGRARGGEIVYATLTTEMLARTDTLQSDADGLVEFLARSRDAVLAILVRELPEGSTRVSVRSAAGADAVALAQQFGGGGHQHRSGFALDLPVTTTRDRVVRAAIEQLAAAESDIRAAGRMKERIS